MCFSIIIGRVNKDTGIKTDTQAAGGRSTVIIPCVPLASRPASQQVRRETGVEMERQAEIRRRAKHEREKVNKRENLRNRVSGPTMLTAPSRSPLYRLKLFLMGQSAAIKEGRRGNRTLPVVFITSTRAPATLLVAAMLSASKGDATSVCHVNQEHSLWTVANKYSNCQ